MVAEIVEGDLLTQPVEVIVNAWNRNFIPWWLLLPQGVSGAIRKRAGSAPFREVGRHGLMAPGAAVLTGAGKLPFRGIIHVAGLNWWWTASPFTIQESVRNAVGVVNREGFTSVAFPLIGAGTGGIGPERSMDLMEQALAPLESQARVFLVRFRA